MPLPRQSNIDQGETFRMAPIDVAALRQDWTVGEIEIIYNLPLPDLIFQAQTAHRRHHNPAEVQGCTLLSIKTGGCPEDCAYCPQSARYQTGVRRDALLYGRGMARRATRQGVRSCA